MKKPYFLIFPMMAFFAMITGFNLDNAIVPKDQIVSGGPPKDGIPAIMAPKFISVAQTRFLDPDDEVIAVRIDGEVKAYPIKILTWHEVVNDSVNGVPIAVTF
jgi:hypothetical protein